MEEKRGRERESERTWCGGFRLIADCFRFGIVYEVGGVDWVEVRDERLRGFVFVDGIINDYDCTVAARCGE